MREQDDDVDDDSEDTMNAHTAAWAQGGPW